MGLVEGTAIVTPAQVEQITGESNLSNLDDDSNGTVAFACVWATSWLIDELDAKGIPVSEIANLQRLMRAAAFYVASQRLMAGEEQDEATAKRAEGYLAEAKRLVGIYRFVSSATDGEPDTNLLLPELGNQDGHGQFDRPLHTWGAYGPFGPGPGWGPLP